MDDVYDRIIKNMGNILNEEGGASSHIAKKNEANIKYYLVEMKKMNNSIIDALIEHQLGTKPSEYTENDIKVANTIRNSLSNAIYEYGKIVHDYLDKINGNIISRPTHY